MNVTPSSSNLRVKCTKTFFENCLVLGIENGEQAAIKGFVQHSARSGRLLKRLHENALYVLPWRDSIHVTYLLMGNRPEAYLISATDEDPHDAPPGWRDKLTKFLDRLWIAGAVEAAKRIAESLDMFSKSTVPKPTHRFLYRNDFEPLNEITVKFNSQEPPIDVTSNGVFNLERVEPEKSTALDCARWFEAKIMRKPMWITSSSSSTETNCEVFATQIVYGSNSNTASAARRMSFNSGEEKIAKYLSLFYSDLQRLNKRWTLAHRRNNQSLMEIISSSPSQVCSLENYTPHQGVKLNTLARQFVRFSTGLAVIFIHRMSSFKFMLDSCHLLSTNAVYSKQAHFEKVEHQIVDWKQKYSLPGYKTRRYAGFSCAAIVKLNRREIKCYVRTSLGGTRRSSALPLNVVTKQYEFGLRVKMASGRPTLAERFEAFALGEKIKLKLPYADQIDCVRAKHSCLNSHQDDTVFSASEDSRKLLINSRDLCFLLTA